MPKQPEYMILSVAAAHIGVTAQRLRQMLKSGECNGRQVPAPVGPSGYYWEISREEADWLRDNPPKGRGRKRGGKR